jgi:hypothetical protein
MRLAARDAGPRRCFSDWAQSSPPASKGCLPVTSPSKPSTKGIFVASFIGTSIEWYDYYIFGTAAALVFGSLF